VFQITLAGKVTLVMDSSSDMPCPNGVTVANNGDLLIAEFFKGNILRARKGLTTVLASGYRGGDGIEQDSKGNLYVSSWTQGKVWKLDRQAKNPVVLLDGLKAAADFYLDQEKQLLLVPDMLAGTVTFLPL
jgi:hypothetical protein